MDYQKELQARQDELQAALKNWTPQGGEQSLLLYQRYVDSGYTALPCAGGWLDQPAWWLNDVTVFDLFGEKHWIPGELKRVKETMTTISKRNRNA